MSCLHDAVAADICARRPTFFFFGVSRAPFKSAVVAREDDEIETSSRRFSRQQSALLVVAIAAVCGCGNNGLAREPRAPSLGWLGSGNDRWILASLARFRARGRQPNGCRKCRSEEGEQKESSTGSQAAAKAAAAVAGSGSRRSETQRARIEGAPLALDAAGSPGFRLTGWLAESA